MRAPRIDSEAPFPAHLRQVGAVQDHEQEAEALLHLPLPLLQHRGGSGDDDGARLLAEQQLAGDEAGLDGLSKAGVVGDEQVHAGQAQRLAQRLHLVGVDLDAGTERRLQEIRVSGRDAVPAQGVQERAEVARRIEALGAEVAPRLLLQDAAVDLEVPVDLQGLTLGIVVGAGQAHPSALVGRLLDCLDQPAARAHLHQIADTRGALGKVGRGTGHGESVYAEAAVPGQSALPRSKSARAETEVDEAPGQHCGVDLLGAADLLE